MAFINKKNKLQERKEGREREEGRQKYIKYY